MMIPGLTVYLAGYRGCQHRFVDGFLHTAAVCLLRQGWANWAAACTEMGYELGAIGRWLHFRLLNIVV